jgi:hypothetical protein
MTLIAGERSLSKEFCGRSLQRHVKGAVTSRSAELCSALWTLTSAVATQSLILLPLNLDEVIAFSFFNLPLGSPNYAPGPTPGAGHARYPARHSLF